MIDYIETARTYRKAIETAVPSLDDKIASTSPSLFPRLTEGGELVKAGTRINWGGTLKRAAVDLWDTAENNPDNAPTLWEDIAYREGYRIIPAVITATLAFSLNEYGWEGDTLYKSLRDGNTFPPSVTPEWWEIVTQNQ